MKAPSWDVRTFKSPEEHDARFPGDPWFSRGTQHEIVRGPRGESQGIRRRMEDQDGWAIDIDTLDDLWQLVRREGEIIIKGLDGRLVPDDQAALEIYDTWRE